MPDLKIVKLIDPLNIVNIPGGFVPRGAYNAGTTYSVGDSVSYNGSSYVLYAAATAGTLPTDATKWQVMANQGAAGATGSPGSTGPAGAPGSNGLVTSVVAGNGISVNSGTPSAPIVAIDTAVTVDKTTSQTLSNKTLNSPMINGTLTQSGGDVLLNNAGGNNDIKLYGNSLPMVYVRKFFDRVGFGIDGTTTTVDSPFDVNLVAKFRNTTEHAGNVSIGSVGPDSVRTLNIDQTYTNQAADQYGFFAVTRNNNAANGTNTLFGGFINGQVNSGNNKNIFGVRGEKAIAQHNGSGTVGTLYAGEFMADNPSTGTVTDMRGIRIDSPTNGGTVTTNIGLSVDNMTVGGTNFAIQTGIGKVQFGDVLDMTSHRINNVTDPSGAQDADTLNARNAAITVATKINKAFAIAMATAL